MATIGVALALAACGSGTPTRSTTSPAPASPAKLEYIAKADKICMDANNASWWPVAATLDILGSADSPDYSKLSTLMREAARSEEKTLVKLRALPAPAGDAAKVAKIWDAAAEAIELNFDTAKSLARRNLSDIKSDVQRGSTGRATYQSLAHQYGFKYCGVN